jgi:hypothetical protein
MRFLLCPLRIELRRKEPSGDWARYVLRRLAGGASRRSDALARVQPRARRAGDPRCPRMGSGGLIAALLSLIPLESP